MAQSTYTHIAELYDAFVQTQFDIPFWLEEVRQTDGEILELMAGTGRVTLPLLEAGVRLTAVDNSPEMLAILHQKLAQQELSAPVHQMDVRKLAFDKRFARIIIPFHAFAELTDRADQEATLTAIHQHLTDDGLFICTLHNPPVRLQSVNDQLKLWGKITLDDNQRTLFLWAREAYDPTERIVSADEFYEVYDAAGLMQSRHFCEIRFQMIDHDTFQAMAEAADFRVVALYGDYQRAAFSESSSPVMIWFLARR